MWQHAPSWALEALGFVTGGLTTLSFVPQVVKAWRTKSTGDLSGAMLAVFTAGVICWLSYGVALGSWPVIVTNACTLALTSVLLWLKLREGSGTSGPR